MESVNLPVRESSKSPTCAIFVLPYPAVRPRFVLSRRFPADAPNARKSIEGLGFTRAPFVPFMENVKYPSGLPPTAVLRDPSQSASARLAAVSALLDDVQTSGASPISPERELENQLVQVRLGMASSLFTALRARHAPTATHSLRVAMGCSSWLLKQNIPGIPCDEIEVAALLHDLGKIGVPDCVLLKPGQLSPEEHVSMEQQRRVGVEILRSCCVSQNVLNIVQNSGAWFDGRREGQTLHGPRFRWERGWWRSSMPSTP